LALLLATLTLAPPVSAFVGPEQVLGGLLYRDENLSSPPGQSCMTCHHPAAGWADPANRRDPAALPVSEGVVPGLFGGRNAPTASYAAFSPDFHWDAGEGLFFGGLFWDGRATGQGAAGSPLGDQALGPFLNPVEMANTMDGVVLAVSQSRYAWLFEFVYPGTDWADVETTYVNIARAIGRFEETRLLNQFNSKYDRVLAGKAQLTKRERRGLELFNGRAQCHLCHPSAPGPDGTPPLFTDFSYDNLGIPTNPQVAALAGPQKIDYGLGAMVDQLMAARPDLTAVDVSSEDDGLGGSTEVVTAEAGKFKVSGLRNVAKSPPYGHNGRFATLEEIVHFYNTRDVPGAGWPPPEVALNVNDAELGNLGLSQQEEKAIVAFLKTLTDGR
jgi:cytochrome c peroxidase